MNIRFISCKKYALGRWHCHIFRGKEKDICIYTLYRVHRKTDDTSGSTTAWMQQRCILRKQKQMNYPRDAIMDDICFHITKDMPANKSVILLGDFNDFFLLTRKKSQEISRIRTG